MSKLLLPDHPIIILPKLAEKIGLNEAIILQQIHYWIEKNKSNNNNFKDGHYWVYNSYPKWRENFKFWSESTIKRAITKLKKNELLIIENYNKMPGDRTNWYRINYEKLKELENHDKGELAIRSKCTDGKINMTQAIPETTTETTKNKNKNNKVHLTCTSYFSSFEDLEPELQNLVTNYEELYIQKTRYSHPRVTQSESNVVVENIDKFLELGGDLITLYKVIYNFFSKDLRYYNIKHCMSEQNLMMQLHKDGVLDADQVFNVEGKFELQV